jgi:hypothetical protein
VHNASKKEQAAVTRAFEAACEELGIGLLGLDVWKRELVAALILRLANAGELDSSVLQRAAVTQFRDDNLNSFTNEVAGREPRPS